MSALLPACGGDAPDRGVRRGRGRVRKRQSRCAFHGSSLSEKGYTGTLEELIEAFRGEQGPKGETGATGPKGDTGDAGLSAYQIYCKYHPNYTGTEEEWLNEFLSGAAVRKHEVTFNTFGGSPVPAQSVPHGDKAEQPENPSKPGYTFVKWLTEGREWVFYGYSVTEDMNFDALWKITNAPAVLIEAQAFSNYKKGSIRACAHHQNHLPREIRRKLGG